MIQSLEAAPLRRTLAAVANGTISVRSLTAALLERVAGQEAGLQAFCHLDPAAALAEATRADASDGALRGLVFAAKDNFDTHDMPTGYGSSIHVGSLPPRDAACVAELRAGGAVLLGKTVSTEFAHRHPGPTRNPHDAGRTPGGSSSGSAAAVGAGFVPLAFGSQTTGSVIRPAAYCGVVGYKPTWGEMNPSGMLANTPSFDTVGLFARHVDDLAIARHALLDDSPAPIEARPVAGLRVAFSRTPWWDDADTSARSLTEDAVALLASAGARVSDFDDAEIFTALEPVNRTISGFEFARTLAHERLYALDRLSPVLRDGRMADGLRASFEDYRAARIALESLRARHDAMLADIDVVVTLPAPGEAPPGLAATGPATFNMPWTTLHNPALTLPVMTGPNGMPIGLQICAARHADRHLLECAEGIRLALT